MTPAITISLVFSLLLTLSGHAAETVDSSFRAIAFGTSDERSKAISQLVRWLQQGEAKQAESVPFYAWDSAPLPNDGTARGPNREHCKILLEAVPKLIDTLRTDQRKDAWAILVRVTSYCPATTDHAIWLTWWETDGRKFFIMMANAK